uniref:Coiled-coil domain containing 157 n=1 Tax=Anser cygnoides TaxID=8845 RepID=A0A8B9DNC8_ANSCY
NHSSTTRAVAKKLPGSLRNSVPRCQGSAGGRPCCVRIVWLLAICFGCNRAQPGTPGTWWLCPPASSGSASSPKRRACCPHGFLPALSPSFVPLGLSLTDCLQPAWFDLGSTFCSVLSPPEKGLQEGYPHAAIHPRGWENGGALTALLASRFGAEHIPRFQEVVEETTGRRTLSATDVKCWASEQSKDLSRISKHLHALLELVNPLKSELAESKKQRDELQEQVEDLARLLQVEKETQAQQRKEAEQSLEVKNKEYLEAVARLERDKDDLRRGAALREEQICVLKEALAAKQAALQELEATKKSLLEDLRTTTVARSRVLELEEEVRLLTGQRESLGQELSAVTTQLEKEKAKVESMLRHKESLQAKQSALLQQLDSLDQEREELQASLGEAEGDRARLAEQLEESREQREQSGHQLREQQELLDTLQQEKLSLEQSISELRENVSRLEEQAQELKEREKLLVFFPELHVPVETQFESTGNITEDMEKQLQANDIRIGVLEQENARLRAALAKVKAAARQGVLQLVPQPQLWTQLSGQRGGEAAGPPSSQGSGDGAGARGGATSRARQRPPGSRWPKPLSAEPTGEAGPCLSLPVRGLLLAPEPRGSGSAARGARPFSSHRTGAHRK